MVKDLLSNICCQTECVERFRSTLLHFHESIVTGSEVAMRISFRFIRQFAFNLAVISTFACTVAAQNANDKCAGLPDYQNLKNALTSVVKQGKESNSGLGNQEWAAVVNRDGIVCAVVFSGPDRSAEWPGSRLIAAEKANTANALSGPNFALSTANLYTAAQPGQSLYSLISAGPPPANQVFSGTPDSFGQPSDPLV